MVDAGARALGCAVFPAGTGQTELQVATIADLKPAGLRRHALVPEDPAREGRGDRRRTIRASAKALVSGEALPGEPCAPIRGERGVRVLQCYTTADLGVIAYESRGAGGADRERGADRRDRAARDRRTTCPRERSERSSSRTCCPRSIRSSDSPRGTSPRSCRAASPCGRTNTRIRGWLGRADQSAKVRGLFVHPSLVAADRAPAPGDPPRAPRRAARERRGRDDAPVRDRPLPAPALPATVVDPSATSASCAARSSCVPPGSLPTTAR